MNPVTLSLNGQDLSQDLLMPLKNIIITDYAGKKLIGLTIFILIALEQVPSYPLAKWIRRVR